LRFRGVKEKFCVLLKNCVILLYFKFLGALAKLRKATISFVMSDRLSLCMEQLGSHWTDFNEILYLNIFRNYVEKIKV
jgi:hypothetical protein